MSNQSEFKRLNFFPGFFTTADDWNDGETYHLEKRRLHNRLLHTPGIMDGLEVVPREDLKVVVKAGTALDADGNLLALFHDRSFTVELPNSLPAEVYLVLELVEEDADWDENLQDPDYSGFRRIAEVASVKQVTEEPSQAQVRLARIQLESADSPIVGPDQVGNNRIDLSVTHFAGAVDPDRAQLLSAIQERLDELHGYHLDRQKRHNRGLHTPGIVDKALSLLSLSASGLRLQVQPGMALDGHGNEIYLSEPSQSLELVPPGSDSQVLYAAIRYQDGFGEYISDLAKPYSDSFEVPEVKILDAEPDNIEWIELGRVDLEADATEIRLPSPGANPGKNEIDRRKVKWAGSNRCEEPQLPDKLLDSIVGVMENKRRAFADLERRFPVPSESDVRHAALNVEIAARTGALQYRNLPGMFALIVALEQEVERELADCCPALATRVEYGDFQSKLSELDETVKSLQSNPTEDEVESVLTLQLAVSERVAKMAEVIFQVPEADAGPDQTVVSATSEADITLDASGSKAYHGRTIKQYFWQKKSP